jgi:spore germination protein
MIENISPVVLLYLDEGEDGTMKISTIIPPLRKEKKKVLTTTTKTLITGRFFNNQKYHREMKAGQIRMIFFSEAMAKRGLAPFLDTLQRNPEISSRVFLSVVAGEMIEYLNSQLRSGQEQIDLYLYKMFTHYEQQEQMTISNMHEFLAMLYNPYADPVLPYYTVENDQLHYAGTALFRGDKMVGVVPIYEDVFFQMLRRKNSVQKSVSLSTEDVMLGSMKTERQVSFADSYQKVLIDVRLTGQVEEIPSELLTGSSWDWQEFEDKLERIIEENLEKVIDRTQSLSVDPFGLGMYTIGWLKRPVTHEQWKTRWSDADAEVRASLHLENTGMIDAHLPD